MKHAAFLITFAIFFISAPAFTQVNPGDWELSLSGTLGSVSTSYEVSSPYYSGSGESEAQTYVSLALRPGYVLPLGFEIEPEILWTATESDKPAFCLTANVAYNLNIPESRIVPFATAGYGAANAIPMLDRLIMGASTDGLDISVLNVGGGMKAFISERVALRVEYRYQHYSQETTGSYYFGPSSRVSFTEKQNFNFHNVLFGLSFFLR